MKLVNALVGFSAIGCSQALVRERRSEDLSWYLTETLSGKKCQKWTSQSPHKHDRTPDNPEYADSGLGDHNYCRNPDNEPRGVWCYTEDASSRWEYCEKLPIWKRPQGDYRGNRNVTKSGKECQKWTSQSPHEHTRTPDNPEFTHTGLGDHNYCRNPDGEKGIWCYTNDAKSRWEYCNLDFDIGILVEATTKKSGIDCDESDLLCSATEGGWTPPNFDTEKPEEKKTTTKKSEINCDDYLIPHIQFPELCEEPKTTPGKSIIDLVDYPNGIVGGWTPPNFEIDLGTVKPVEKKTTQDPLFSLFDDGDSLGQGDVDDFNFD